MDFLRATNLPRCASQHAFAARLAEECVQILRRARRPAHARFLRAFLAFLGEF